MYESIWVRWGRGDCEGYSINLGDGSLRFNARVVRGLQNTDTGAYSWRASIHGGGEQHFESKEKAMVWVELEMRDAAETVVRQWAAYKSVRR